MDETLNAAAENGDINQLYTLLSQDPHLLDKIDHISFIDTPLHKAVRAGQTHFAIEIISLKPSLASKLDNLGMSPIHLALQTESFQMVRSFLAIDSNIVRVKGKGRITPLHYVAETDNIDLVAEFLCACPSSIDDLTIKSETALHVAVKKHKFGAFKVLLGWMRRANKDDMLNWKDEDGNTVFHIATATNQIEVLKMLRKRVKKNSKNLNGMTAMDIYTVNRNSLSREVGKILKSTKAKPANKLDGSKTSLADYLSQELSLVEKRDKLLGIGDFQNSNGGGSDMRNAILVVSTLIATATYQAALSPPGGYWQDNGSITTNTTTIVTHIAGQMIMPFQGSVYFYAINGIAFYMSMWLILTVIMGLPYWSYLYFSICFFLYAYYASLQMIFPSHLFSQPFVLLNYVVALVITLSPGIAFTRHKKRKARLDTSRGTSI